ncbi:MAG: DUF1294 domain-containing protein [Clostridia bacterium]|nr:DUF1294 domain-containing protein [Clostridia bacterium]
MRYLVLYLILISLIGVLEIVVDKSAAVRNRSGADLSRISERTLLLTAALGGAAAMLAAMNVVRHKTRKKKFTVTLPVMAVIHAAAVVLLAVYGV